MKESTLDAHRVAVERVIQAFHANLEEPLDLRGMAKIAYKSPFHFNRTFRLLAGIPPSRFLYAVRLERAAALLINTHRSVLDICYDVGYNSLGTFTRRFTELMGISPTRFRGMAHSFRQDELRHALGEQDPAGDPICNAPESDLEGIITTPEEFDGVVLVGLFPTAIPQGKPVVCTMALNQGRYSLRSIPDGDYYLFAAGLPLSGDPIDSFRNDLLLRGGGGPITVKAGTITGKTDLILRPPEPMDPPMLVTFPLLIRQKLTNTTATAGETCVAGNAMHAEEVA